MSIAPIYTVYLQYMNNPKTWILIVFLLCIALFLGGFRLGKHVERLDKSYVPPPTPTLNIKPSPTVTNNPLTFTTYTHKGCGVSFLFPRPYKTLQNASDSASLEYNEKGVQNTEQLSLTCQKKPSGFEKLLNTATPSGSFMTSTKKINYYLGRQASIQIEFKNTKNQYVNIIVGKNLFELVSKTLKLL